MTRLVVGPFNRVEGDLEVSLELADGAVSAAYVSAPMYRGFEQFLVGRAAEDAMVLAPRICGICSVSQSAAAAAALAQMAGAQVPVNGRLCANLMHALENVADHLAHFYLFYLPDFAVDAYAGRAWHAEAARRFRAVTGAAAREFLPARARFMETMGVLAGRWPHTLALRPGGSARAIEAAERLRIAALLAEFRDFLERTVFGGALEDIEALASEDALRGWALGPGADTDFGRFFRIAEDLALHRLGRGVPRLVSYGAYHAEAGHVFARGVWDGALRPLEPGQIAEDHCRARFGGARGPLAPREGVTLPEPEKAGAYTWCKAPRLAGSVVETGALARQVVDGHPLARALVAEHGPNARDRVVARLLEVARLLPRMQAWAAALRPGAPFCADPGIPADGEGAGLIEAARGSLGHWVAVAEGRILRYQIVSPTTWNFSPRDAAGVPGAVEQALVGTPVEPGAGAPVAVQHVVRSFDPCMVCTVH
jgi:hydrogenase large subunit